MRYFLFFFLKIRIPKAKRRVGVFLNSIAFKNYRTCGVNARKSLSRKKLFRIIKFSDMSFLIIIFSIIWPNLTEIDLIFVKL